MSVAGSGGEEQALARALDWLRAGRVVAAATETFFGLLADVTQPVALEALQSLKPRGADKGVPHLLPRREAWPGLVAELPELAQRLADEFWPGPLTLALPAAPETHARVVLDGRVAVRLPGPCAAATLAATLGRPITATSANLPGEPPAVAAAQVRGSFTRELGSRLLVLDGRAPGGHPSTVVLVEGVTYRIVRAGAVPDAAIDRVARRLDPSFGQR